MTAKEILAKASEIVSGDRQRDYGHPRDNHGCTAGLWRAYLFRRGNDCAALTPRDVCMLNILQKVSRDANAPKDDNLVDIIGYALNAAMIDEATDAATDTATDTPANSESVEREDKPDVVPAGGTYNGEVVRCFEWIGGGSCSCIMFRGSDFAVHETAYATTNWTASLDATIDSGLWREFQPSEWDAKVAAVKSASKPVERAAQ